MLGAAIRRRLRSAGVSVDAVIVDQLTAYLDLLAKWNRKINLSGFDLDNPTVEAIDRLIVEPLLAVQQVKPSDRRMIDLGSGGGSPALPMKIAVPVLQVVLVESKVRKSAFLRDAIRQVGLKNIEVETRRSEGLLTNATLYEAADLITVRAVRADTALWRTCQFLARPDGRVFWFGSDASQSNPSPPFVLDAELPLVSPSRLSILVNRAR